MAINSRTTQNICDKKAYFQKYFPESESWHAGSEAVDTIGFLVSADFRPHEIACNIRILKISRI